MDLYLDMFAIADGFCYPFHVQPASIAQVLLQPSPEPIWSGTGAVPYLQALEKENSSISKWKNQDLERID